MTLLDRGDDFSNGSEVAVCKGCDHGSINLKTEGVSVTLVHSGTLCVWAVKELIKHKLSFRSQLACLQDGWESYAFF